MKAVFSHLSGGSAQPNFTAPSKQACLLRLASVFKMLKRYNHEKHMQLLTVYWLCSHTNTHSTHTHTSIALANSQDGSLVIGFVVTGQHLPRQSFRYILTIQFIGSTTLQNAKIFMNVLKIILCLLFFPKNLVINVALQCSASYTHSRKCFRHADCLTLMMLWTCVVFPASCSIACLRNLQGYLSSGFGKN